METYIVIELQTMADGKVANLVTQHASRAEAESKFFTVLAAAAVSDMPCHAAALMTSTGTAIESRFYKRGE